MKNEHFSRIGKKRSSEKTQKAHNLQIAVSQAVPATNHYGMVIIFAPQRFRGDLID